jgi:predicted SPOUT superfamily RNA methylase MTH1
LRRDELKVKRFSVALPASIVSDTPHLREKTAKLGAIARAMSIFGVNEVILYRDDPKRDQSEDVGLCSEILQFLDTPQYLRKRIFKLSPTLRFTGILPPLQAPHHNVPHTLSEVHVGDGPGEGDPNRGKPPRG